MGVPFYISTSSVGDLPFLCIAVFYFCHPKSCEAVSHCYFNLHFPNGYWCWTSLHELLCHLYILFSDGLFSGLLLLLKMGFFVFLLLNLESSCVQPSSPLSDMWFAKCFLPLCGILFAGCFLEWKFLIYWIFPFIDRAFVRSLISLPNPELLRFFSSVCS